MPMKKPCIAVFDVGTTSIKVCLFSPDVSLLACSVQEYPLQTAGPCAEVDAGTYLSAMRRGVTAALAQAEGFAVAAIGLSTQGETLVPVDRAGEPLHPFLVWLDARAEKEAAALGAAFPEQTFYETTGLPAPSGALPLAKLLWIRQTLPDVFSKTYKFLLLEDYLLFFLTGNFLSERSLQTSTGYFSLQTDDFWEDALQWAGIPRSMLPDCLESGEKAGVLLPHAARFLGLPADIPVFTGAMDQTAAALSAGGLTPGTITETTGTALVAAACTDAPVFAKAHHVTIYRHAVRGRFLYLPIGNTAGMALKWFRDEFCRDLPEQKAYRRLDALAESVEPGSGGVTFLPYLSGSVDPDFCPQAKAAFFGATLSTGRAAFARAVMESVAFLLSDFLTLLEALSCPCKALYSLGGGAKSRVWQQIKADVCNRTLFVPACREASAQGAALLAAWGSGWLSAPEMPKKEPAACFSPDAEAILRYQKPLARFHALYQAVKPLYV